MTGLQARITVLRHACWWQIRASVTTTALSLSPRSVAYSLNQMSESQFARFTARAALPGDASLCQVVNAVQAIPYGDAASTVPEGGLTDMHR